MREYPNESIRCSNCKSWLHGSHHMAHFVWNDEGPVPGIYGYRETKYVNWFVANELVKYAVCSMECARDRAVVLNGKLGGASDDSDLSSPGDSDAECSFTYPSSDSIEHLPTDSGDCRVVSDPDIVELAEMNDLLAVKDLVQRVNEPCSIGTSSTSSVGSSLDGFSDAMSDVSDCEDEFGCTWDPVRVGKTGQDLFRIRMVETLIDSFRLGNDGFVLEHVLRNLGCVRNELGPQHNALTRDRQQHAENSNTTENESDFSWSYIEFVQGSLGMELEDFLDERTRRAYKLDVSLWGGCRELRKRMKWRARHKCYWGLPPNSVCLTPLWRNCRVIFEDKKPDVINWAEVARLKRLQWPGPKGDKAILVKVNNVNVRAVDDDSLRRTVLSVNLPVEFEFAFGNDLENQSQLHRTLFDYGFHIDDSLSRNIVSAELPVEFIYKRPVVPVDASRTDAETEFSQRVAQLVNDRGVWADGDENHWFGDTALIAASRNGHPDMVRFLLEERADPTLVSCPEEDVFVDAMEAANGMAMGQNLVRTLLDAARPFWNNAAYRSADYSPAKRFKTADNAPTDARALREALDRVVFTESELSVARAESAHEEATKQFLVHKAIACASALQVPAFMRPTCCYWLQGRCRYDDLCHFAHNEEEGPCQFGAKCWHGHGMD